MAKKKFQEPEDEIPPVAAESKPDPKKVLSSLPPEDQEMIDVVVDGKPVTDNDLIDMSSMFREIGSDEPQAPAAAPTGEKQGLSPTTTSPVVAAPEPKTYKVGRKTFTSAEELAAYVDGLEQTKHDLLDQIQLPEAQKAPEIKPGSMVFEDPEKAFDLAEERAVARIEAKLEAERRLKKQSDDAIAYAQRTWTDFYRANPDLVGFEDTVMHQAQELQRIPGNDRMPASDALKLVADRARIRKAELRKRFIPDEELPSGPAITSGSTKASVASAPAVERSETFISQLNGIRKKGAL